MLTSATTVAVLVVMCIMAVFLGHIITAIALGGWAYSRAEVASNRKALGR